nr:hypothetical protein GCM10020092_038040 [Actinoplanes digitatis]
MRRDGHRVVEVVDGGERGVLGRPVRIGDAQARAGAQDLGHRARRQGLAAGDELDDTPEPVRPVVGGQPEQAGGEEQAGDRPVAQERRQAVRGWGCRRAPRRYRSANSGAKISKVDASNASGASRAKRAAAPGDRNPGSCSSRTTARHGIIAPFGRPVVPDVKAM